MDWLWVAAIALIVIGIVGTVLPALPGIIFVFGGIALAAYADDFTRISQWTIGVLAVLAIIGWVLDYVAGLMGAKKAGASKLAIIGAAIGTVAGIFMGLVGVLFMPLVGAAIGEYIYLKGHPEALQRAGKVGVATWLGIIAGLIGKVVIVFIMLGIFGAALLVP
ncbi:MAG: hypothetical protein RL341_1019 [Pseudomonadota bacterium]|jgi:uncharacterized protein YqgC (DUF456 family)